MFYLVEISTGDSKIAGRAIYSSNTENEAVAMFHSKLGTAMKSDLYDSELVFVVDENGKMLKREKYAKPVIVEDETTENVLS